MTYLLFSGSLRKDSLNKKLIHVMSRICHSRPDTSCMVADLQPLKLPVYDGDVEAVGIPDGVHTLGGWIASADALIISSPEYNGSIAGSFKNTIDWLSRLKPVPLAKKPVLLMGASPGAFGAMSALAAARAPFERLGAYLYPQSFALPLAHQAFDETGGLKDPAVKSRLETLLAEFDGFAKKLK